MAPTSIANTTRLGKLPSRRLNYQMPRRGPAAPQPSQRSDENRAAPGQSTNVRLAFDEEDHPPPAKKMS